jgi:Thymidylate synthase
VRYYANFTEAANLLTQDFLNRAYLVHSDKWQSVPISHKPEMAMRELFSVSFTVPTGNHEEIVHWQKDILPNLPFADVHFEERVSGHGTNPGEAWKIWPWGNAADAHRTEAGRFTHTYQERFWPNNLEDKDARPEGIRYAYGDYGNLIHHLRQDPLSRQAYLPIWYPEDLACDGRKPCTLGYHFFMRHDYLHITYFIRSCDFIRHWRDDCYLAIRLLLETLARLRALDNRWRSVRPGMYVMHITSLHMFVNDWIKLGGRN